MKKQLWIAFCLTFATAAALQGHTLKVRLDKPGAEIPATMYGLFFEDINYAADGGLYAELIKNRSFEFHPNHFQGWNCAGNVSLRSDGPFERNPHYVRLSSAGHKEKRSSISNEGFFGICVKKDEKYELSLWARADSSDEVRIKVELIDPASAGETQSVASTDIIVKSGEWRKYRAELTPSQTVEKGELRIFLTGMQDSVDLEHISLFPADTYKKRSNGMRKDIAKALEGLKPGIFRFPGGCIVEGADAATRYQWKNSVGPVENRPLNENRWQSTFTNRFYPDYFQSLGLGFYEYFQFCEDIGAAPLPVLNVGLVCQYQNDLKNQIPTDSLQQFIDDALDLIEFANGKPTSGWGKIRAQMGHPEPFNLKYLAIGNEQWGSEYVERLKPFVTAIRSQYPDIRIIGSSGPGPEGDKFDFLWPEMKKIGVDLVDEHFYKNEKWFLAQGDRYDSYSRKGPKVFAGEYACHGAGKKYNHFNAALMEAAFMTGLERNADVVEMATYAPLLAHVKGWQWRPDLIWFDNSSIARTSSYYVQQLFSQNKGTRIIPILWDSKPIAGKEGQDGLFASAVIDDPASAAIVKIVNTADHPSDIAIDFRLPKAIKQIAGMEIITLKSSDPMAENTVGNEETVFPVSDTVNHAIGTLLKDTIPAKSFRIYKLNLK